MKTLRISVFIFGSLISFAQSMESYIDKITNRHMHVLDTEFCKENKIVMIKSISSVTTYSGRDMLVVQLIDGSEVPFYRSSGANSGLPASWLPFFGISTQNGTNKNGWINKNYSFNRHYGTEKSANPLYHCGCYVLAQVANELDGLTFISPHSMFSDGTSQYVQAERLNTWIGGKVLDNDGTMPQRFNTSRTFTQRPPLTGQNPGQNPYVRKETINTTTTGNKNLFGPFRTAEQTKGSISESGEFLYSNRRLVGPDLDFMVADIKKSEKFVTDIQKFMSQVEKISLSDSDYSVDYHAFKQLLVTYLSLSKIWADTGVTKDKINAYLALKMLHRFSFNYFFRMLQDVSDGIDYRTEIKKVLLTSRAAWLFIKHEECLGNKDRLKKIKDLLTVIKRNSPDCFRLVCLEHPVQMTRFAGGLSYNTNVSVQSHDYRNEEILEKIHKEMKSLYDTFDNELYNFQRLVKNKRNTWTLGQIVSYYSDEEHIGGLEMNREYKKIVLEVLLSLKNTELKTAEKYVQIITKLNHIKNNTTSAFSKDTERKAFVLCIQQLATWLYMDALAKIQTLR